MTKGSNVERSVELLVVGMSKLRKNVESLAESMEFVISNMVTKNEFEAGMAELQDELHGEMGNMEERLGQRINGISNRLDYELDERHQLKVRVTTLENKG